MSYASNYANRATIFDTGDVNAGDQVKSIYDELAAGPGAFLDEVGVPYKAGAWFNSSRTFAVPPSNERVAAQNVLELSPMVIDHTITFDRIGTYVTVAGAAGTFIRLGIYNSNGNGLPSTLVAGSAVTQDGTVLNTATPGGEVISVTLGRGRYYLAAVAQATAGTPTMPTTYFGGASQFSLPLESTDFTTLLFTTNVAIAVSGTTGALPADLSAATLGVRGSVFSLAVRMV